MSTVVALPCIEGSGVAIDNGNLSMTEQWFVDGIQHCIDTFEITGVESDYKSRCIWMLGL